MTYEQIKENASQDWREFTNPEKIRILIGTGTCGLAAGAGEIKELIKDYISSMRGSA